MSPRITNTTCLGPSRSLQSGPQKYPTSRSRFGLCAYKKPSQSTVKKWSILQYGHVFDRSHPKDSSKRTIRFLSVKRYNKVSGGIVANDNALTTPNKLKNFEDVQFYTSSSSRIGFTLKKKLSRFDDQKLANIAIWARF
jgi:hypothetical protein